MAISVVVHRAADGSPMTQERYDNAGHFLVRDNGLLAVTESHFRDATVIAVYAPGEWCSVERVEEQKAAVAAA